MERCEQKKDPHIIFIELEKAYNKVARNIIWWALQKYKVSIKYITLIKNMYDNVMASVQRSDGDTNDFPINIRLHQGSALSPYLFALMMDEVTKDIQNSISWCMFFTDDVILVDESMTELIRNLNCGNDLWR
jgi:ABC-type transport system involved in multi-copper enzyme maturation permease subunit